MRAHTHTHTCVYVCVCVHCLDAGKLGLWRAPNTQMCVCVCVTLCTHVQDKQRTEMRGKLRHTPHTKKHHIQRATENHTHTAPKSANQEINVNRNGRGSTPSCPCSVDPPVHQSLGRRSGHQGRSSRARYGARGRSKPSCGPGASAESGVNMQQERSRSIYCSGAP